jgi:hypothetical protein
MLADISLSGILWAMLWLSLFILWFWLIVTIFTDLVHDREMNGWGKAAWTLFVIIMPLLGILIYLIVRGKGMQERSISYAEYQKSMFTQYQATASRGAGGSGGSADQLEKLSQLHASGALTDEEYATAKAKAI